MRASSSSANGLPAVQAEAAALSRRLVERIRSAIDEAGGWIGFDRYMAMALFEPGLGYYANGRPVFGSAGDFITAPELTPLFGDTIARQLAHWFADPESGPALRDVRSGKPVILEFGAGSGVLAAHLLNALERLGIADVEYRILELSGNLQALQRKTLAARAPGLAGRVRWLEALPAGFRGIVIGNEVLDAMPVRLFERDDDGLHEVGVVRAPVEAAGQSAAAGVDGGAAGAAGFAWQLRPADAALQAGVAALARFGVQPADWASPYRSELAPQRDAWLHSLGEAMESGIVLLLDYGFPAAEYYHPQRVGGTLMGHLRHRSHPDPFLWPGLSDITAHVDFSQLCATARAAGLQPIGYLSQARFLLNCGLLDVFAELPRDEQRVWFAQAQAVQKLVSEAEMGELFKVIALARDVPGDLVWPGFSQGDRLHRLGPVEPC